MCLTNSPKTTGEVGIWYVHLVRTHLCQVLLNYYGLTLSYLLEGLIEVALLQ